MTFTDRKIWTFKVFLLDNTVLYSLNQTTGLQFKNVPIKTMIVSYTIHIHNSLLEQTNSFKLFGVIFDGNFL